MHQRGRDVDRHRNVEPLIGKGIARLARFYEHKAGKVAHPACAFALADEVVRWNLALDGVFPAYQRFYADNLAGLHQYLGLVGEIDFSA